MGKKIGNLNFDRIHKKFDTYHDDILILKKDMGDVKKCLKTMDGKFDDLSNQLFVGNGKKSIMTRLSILETKVVALFACLSGISIIVAKFVVDLFLKG